MTAVSLEVARRDGPPDASARRAAGLPVLPDDEFDRALVDNVHPPGWQNPVPRRRYHLVVIGGGTAGLVSAVAAATLGAKVAIVEKHLLGGDCLNVGCVPSKGLLRAARAARDVAAAGTFGVRLHGGVEVDFTVAAARMRARRAHLSRHDSAARLAELGIDVFLGEAAFVAPDAVMVDGAHLRFARAILATGTRPAMPPVPGLAELGVLTNETVFSLTERPRRLVVIGAGPIGCELAQAFRRFGSEVTIVSLDPQLLPREDSEAAAVLAGVFEREGIRLELGARIRRGERRDDGKVVVFEREGREHAVAGDAILVAVGRVPNVEGLELRAAGIAFDRAGVRVDDRLRTTNPRVYAAGDICSPYKFTHAADAMARVAVQNALFLGRRKASRLVIPWCTYTDPEVAHVGLDAREAERRAPDVVTVTVPLAVVDRAVIDDEAEGFARVYAERRSGRILGATLVARRAGDLIAEVALAITAGVTLDTLSRTIHPYPTQAAVWQRVGDAWLRARLTPRVRRWLGWYLGLWGSR
jgi:pyruvate/2-oxoglutarate dehydrogenase complex dihydrolipoamide dehydrogenase (E3) component